MSYRDASMQTAKIFGSGRSRAVRLPKDFRFDTDEVRIRRHGNAVILEPLAHDWAWLTRVIGPLADDFKEALPNSRISMTDRRWIFRVTYLLDNNAVITLLKGIAQPDVWKFLSCP